MLANLTHVSWNHRSVIGWEYLCMAR